MNNRENCWVFYEDLMKQNKLSLHPHQMAKRIKNYPKCVITANDGAVLVRADLADAITNHHQALKALLALRAEQKGGANEQ